MALMVLKTGQVLQNVHHTDFVCCVSHNLDWGSDLGFWGRNQSGEVPCCHIMSWHYVTSICLTTGYISLGHLIKVGFARFFHDFPLSLLFGSELLSLAHSQGGQGKKLHFLKREYLCVLSGMLL